MSRIIHRLSDRRAKAARLACIAMAVDCICRCAPAGPNGRTEPPGRRRLSRGFFVITPHGDRQMGLGSLDTVSLAEARERAAEARKLCARGLDPLEANGRNKRKRPWRKRG